MGDIAVGDERQLKSVAVHKSPAHVLPVCASAACVCVRMCAALWRIIEHAGYAHGHVATLDNSYSYKTERESVCEKERDRQRETDRRGVSVFLICGLTV